MCLSLNGFKWSFWVHRRIPNRLFLSVAVDAPSSIESSSVHSSQGQTCTITCFLRGLLRGGSDTASFSNRRVQIEKYHFEIFGSVFERTFTSALRLVGAREFTFTERCLTQARCRASSDFRCWAKGHLFLALRLFSLLCNEAEDLRPVTWFRFTVVDDSYKTKFGFASGAIVLYLSTRGHPRWIDVQNCPFFM